MRGRAVGGARAAVNHVGDVRTTIGPDLVSYGNYTVVDLGGRYYFDDAKHHRVGVRLENALDEEYGRPQRAFR